MTEGGGIAAPVEARKSSKDYKAERQGSAGRPMTFAYEEVTIVDGGFDRSNIKVLRYCLEQMGQLFFSHVTARLSQLSWEGDPSFGDRLSPFKRGLRIQGNWSDWSAPSTRDKS